MQRLYSKPLISTITINVSIVGMNGSGKSALLVKYLTRRFIVEYAPYLSDSYTKTDSIDGQEITLNIQDTSDSDDMDMEDILKWSQAIIVLFSITSRRSFYRAQELIETLRQTCSSSVSNRASPFSPQRQSMHSNQLPNSAATSPLSPLSPGHTGSLRRAAVYGTTVLQPPTLILVANKSDLDRFRLVEKMEAEEFAKRHGIPYYETTAAETYQEVQSIFHSVVRLSPVGRLLKSRVPNGSGVTFAARSITSNTNSLGSATGSVLSSLAVSPGLLLQKKSTPISPTYVGQSETATFVQNETDQPGVGPVSKLTNLRFRAASPPTFTKNLRSPSPAWPVGRSPSESGPHSSSLGQTLHAPTSNISQPGQLGSSMTTLSTSSSSIAPVVPEHSARATTPGSASRVSLTTQILKAVQPSTDDNSANKQATSQHGVATPTSGTSRTQAHAAQQPPPPPPPLPPKKIPMSFRFFSKKSK